MQRDGGPGGAGGAGNPTGGSFTGPAEALEIIGDHVYGYSGNVPTDDSETDLLNANSGNYYAAIKVLFTYATDVPTAGDDFLVRIRFNNTIIYQTIIQHVQTQNGPQTNINLILPPYTGIRCTAENVTADTTYNQAVVIAGRIYRG